MWDRVGVAVALCATLGALGARSTVAQEPDSLPTGVTDSTVVRGRALFGGSARCTACHGLEGRGTERGPDLTDHEWLHGDGSYESIVELVKSGVTHREAKSGQPMPMRGWVPLDDEHVRMVAAYVWRLSHPPMPR